MQGDSLEASSEVFISPEERFMQVLHRHKSPQERQIAQWMKDKLARG